MPFKKKESIYDTKNAKVLDILKTAKCQFLLRNFSDCVDSCVNGFEAVGNVPFPSEVTENRDTIAEWYIKLCLVFCFIRYLKIFSLCFRIFN